MITPSSIGYLKSIIFNTPTCLLQMNRPRCYIVRHVYKLSTKDISDVTSDRSQNQKLIKSITAPACFIICRLLSHQGLHIDNFASWRIIKDGKKRGEQMINNLTIPQPPIGRQNGRFYNTHSVG